jgi:hypothetical protein
MHRGCRLGALDNRDAFDAVTPMSSTTAMIEAGAVTLIAARGVLRAASATSLHLRHD